MSATWAREFGDRFGFPDRYLTLDCETTGFHDSDVITQFGCVLVKNRQVRERLSLVLDWSRPEYLGEYDMQLRFDALQRSIEYGKDGLPNGKKMTMNLERMKREGVEPRVALGLVVDMLSCCRQEGIRFVAHNGAFDQRFIENALEDYLPERRFQFAPGEVYDTGAMVKASQLGVGPAASDTLRAYTNRICSTRRKGVYWSLDGYCIERYKLRYPEDTGIAHDAEYDCELTHRLFEVFRRLGEEEACLNGAFQCATAPRVLV